MATIPLRTKMSLFFKNSIIRKETSRKAKDYDEKDEKSKLTPTNLNATVKACLQMGTGPLLPSVSV